MSSGVEHPNVLRHVDLETLVELVAADPRQVVALRVEEQAPQQVARVLQGRGLARPLLLEHLDDRLLLALGGVLLERVAQEDGVAEEREDVLVGRRVELVVEQRSLGRLWKMSLERALETLAASAARGAAS